MSEPMTEISDRDQLYARIRTLEETLQLVAKGLPVLQGFGLAGIIKSDLIRQVKDVLAGPASGTSKLHTKYANEQKRAEDLDFFPGEL